MSTEPSEVIMEFYRFEVYIPLFYNDGQKIGPEKFEQIKEEIICQYGGLTTTSLFGGRPVYNGFWTHSKTGHVYHDKNAIFTVLTPREGSIDFFLKKKAEWASQLAQEELLIIVQEVQTL